MTKDLSPILTLVLPLIYDSFIIVTPPPQSLSIKGVCI